MLQLQLLLHAIFLALTHIHIHVPVRPLIPIHIPILTPIPISIHIRILITARTLTLSNILTSVPLPRAHRGIPPHLSLLAGS